MIPVLLLLSTLIMWDAPTTNCDEAQTPLTDLDHYEIEIFTVDVLMWNTCFFVDDTDTVVEYLCPVYIRNIMRLSTVMPSVAVADPELGEVVGWRDPEAFDVAGNSSAQCVQ